MRKRYGSVSRRIGGTRNEKKNLSLRLCVGYIVSRRGARPGLGRASTARSERSESQMCGHGMRTNSFFRPHWDFFHPPAAVPMYAQPIWPASGNPIHTRGLHVCKLLVFSYVPLENLSVVMPRLLRVSLKLESRDLLTLLTLTCLVSYTGRCQLIRDPRARGIRDLSANRLRDPGTMRKIDR